MRRSQVGVWTSALAASVFALFGAGAQNLLWAFQVTFTGALVLGLVHLLLADHDGPLDRRDWLGLAAGFLGLMCSGVAVTMVFVVGVAALLRRGWRITSPNLEQAGLLEIDYQSLTNFSSDSRWANVHPAFAQATPSWRDST